MFVHLIKLKYKGYNMKLHKLFASLAVSSLLVGAGSAVFASGGCGTPVPVDIHPTSCPNPINVGSNGLVPAAMLGTEAWNVQAIDLTQGVELTGYVGTTLVIVKGIKPAYEDVATPDVGVKECCDANSCNEYAEDGFTDLTIKFPMQGSGNEKGVADLLAGMENGETRCLTIQAWTISGHRYYGKDVVVVRGVKK